MRPLALALYVHISQEAAPRVTPQPLLDPMRLEKLRRKILVEMLVF